MSINLQEHFRKEFVTKFGEIPENDSELRPYIEKLINTEFDIRADLNFKVRTLRDENKRLKEQLETDTSVREAELKASLETYKEAYGNLLGKLYKIIEDIPRDI